MVRKISPTRNRQAMLVIGVIATMLIVFQANAIMNLSRLRFFDDDDCVHHSTTASGNAIDVEVGQQAALEDVLKITQDVTAEVCRGNDQYRPAAAAMEEVAFLLEGVGDATNRRRTSSLPIRAWSSLVADLDCNALHRRLTKLKTTVQVNFLATGTNNHTQFLTSYAFFAISWYPNATVEIVTPNHTDFIRTHARGLSWLHHQHGPTRGRICVRDFAEDHANRTLLTNTWRFMEPPILRKNSEYTYIGDVDIYMYEPVVEPNRLRQMEHFGIPYSNVIRRNDFVDGDGRLTGLMLVRNDDFYTPALLRAQKTIDATGNDERVSYRIVQSAKLGFPIVPDENTTDPDDIALGTYRPEHGMHLSLSRGPYGGMCLISWKNHANYADRWCVMLSTPHITEMLYYDYSGYSMMLFGIEKVEAQFNQNMSMYTVGTKKLCVPPPPPNEQESTIGNHDHE
mmetsp:Transcript_9230/g.26382  ORF Transcript_9230/g.26382 Transcript_9230/m.26382 type:complete len:454 (-) Transcript_9230:388-1749(-)